MQTTIYLVCRPCDDTYYDGHPTQPNPTQVAFTTMDAACAYCKEHNIVTPDDGEYADYALYPQQVILDPESDAS